MKPQAPESDPVDTARTQERERSTMERPPPLPSPDWCRVAVPSPEEDEAWADLERLLTPPDMHRILTQRIMGQAA